jgi:hypothetical protein
MWRGIKIVDAAQVYAQLPNFLAGVIKKGQLFIVQATFLTVLLLVCRNIFTTLVENLMGLRIENAFVWPMTHHKSLIKLCIYTE